MPYSPHALTRSILGLVLVVLSPSSRAFVREKPFVSVCQAIFTAEAHTPIGNNHEAIRLVQKFSAERFALVQDAELLKANGFEPADEVHVREGHLVRLGAGNDVDDIATSAIRLKQLQTDLENASNPLSTAFVLTGANDIRAFQDRIRDRTKDFDRRLLSAGLRPLSNVNVAVRAALGAGVLLGSWALAQHFNLGVMATFASVVLASPLISYLAVPGTERLIDLALRLDTTTERDRRNFELADVTVRMNHSIDRSSTYSLHFGSSLGLSEAFGQSLRSAKSSEALSDQDLVAALDSVENYRLLVRDPGYRLFVDYVQGVNDEGVPVLVVTARLYRASQRRPTQKRPRRNARPVTRWLDDLVPSPI